MRGRRGKENPQINLGAKHLHSSRLHPRPEDGAKYNGISPAFTLGALFSMSPAKEAGDIAGENELLFELR